MNDSWQATWPEYVRRHAGGERNADIAERTTISASAIGRWFPDAKPKQHRPDADHVVTFARAYGRPVNEALVAASYLEPKDLKDRRVIDLGASAGELTADELLDELSLRIAERGPRTPRGEIEDLSAILDDATGVQDGLKKRGEPG